ncbi:flagellar biosynthesis protein FlhB [Novosphingobium kaempferiae]|uniref:flagellar biosynthesis protein FlhB n=1 Tax=Novosphingobium kaempferiae TaxID=2896849 RepID=UPI001E505398|nr:flagellar biosynthesis protein FlhB [Novosphingobium kaempferiae]
MADEADKDQRTHEPTPKKLEDARKRGEVAIAPEVRHATMMAGALAVTGWLGLSAMERLGTMLKRLWGDAQEFPLDPEGAQGLATGVMWHALVSLLPVFAVLLTAAIGTVFLQGRVVLSWSRLSPKWSKLSPASGAKRLFGTRALVEFAKTLAKLGVIGLVVWLVFAPRMEGADGLVGRSPGAIGAAAGQLAFEILRAVVALVAALALFDFLWQRRSFLQRMRMTLQEVKDEHKQSEGDPKIKAKIRQIQMQRSRKRMMAAVPTASVIVTNPTHYAVALKYEHGVTAAPTVVAKGVDAVALRIREVGREAGVPVIENPPLARALFAAVEIDHPIPIEHYQAVAEIIGYVLRLAKKVGK